MTERRKIREHIVNAAQAHTDLSMFYACIDLMDGSHVSADSYADTQRLISLCQKAAGRCLCRYELAIEKAGGAAYGERRASTTNGEAKR